MFASVNGPSPTRAGCNTKRVTTMKIICYVDSQCNTHYDKINPPKALLEKTIEKWREDHPDTQIVYIFDAKYDEIRDEIKRRQAYEDRCLEYGLNPADFHTRVHADNSVYRLIGLQTHKTKYKILWENIHTRKLMRSTVAWAKAVLETHRIGTP